MISSFDDRLLVLAHERKVHEAVGILEHARHRVSAAAAGARGSSRALRNEAAQAQRRSAELLAEAARLTGLAERLVAEARAIYGERTVAAPRS